MGRKPKNSRPSFFKVLIKDYTTRLSLPHVFVQRYGKFLAESAKLRTNSEETWAVKLEETDDDDGEYCFFTEGWNKFAKGLELELGEFLVFWFNIGESTFDVSVYGVDGCEREISTTKMGLMALDSHADEDFESGKGGYNAPDANNKRRRNCIPEGDAKSGSGGEIESGDFGKETRPRFEIVLKISHTSRVHLYKEFVEAAGLTGKTAAVLEYPPKQRYWPVTLDQRRWPYPRLEMAVGWRDFRKENGLVFGKTYSFEFDPAKNVIQVKEQKRGRSAGMNPFQL